MTTRVSAPESDPSPRTGGTGTDATVISVLRGAAAYLRHEDEEPHAAVFDALIAVISAAAADRPLAQVMFREAVYNAIDVPAADEATIDVAINAFLNGAAAPPYTPKEGL